MIGVHVELHGLCRLLLAEANGSRALSIADDACIGDILGELGARDLAWLVAVNGSVARPDQRLHDGDRLDIYPPLEGG